MPGELGTEGEFGLDGNVGVTGAGRPCEGAGSPGVVLISGSEGVIFGNPFWDGVVPGDNGLRFCGEFGVIAGVAGLIPGVML